MTISQIVVVVVVVVVADDQSSPPRPQLGGKSPRGLLNNETTNTVSPRRKEGFVIADPVSRVFDEEYIPANVARALLHAPDVSTKPVSLADFDLDDDDKFRGVDDIASKELGGESVDKSAGEDVSFSVCCNSFFTILTS